MPSSLGVSRYFVSLGGCIRLVCSTLDLPSGVRWLLSSEMHVDVCDCDGSERSTRLPDRTNTSTPMKTSTTLPLSSKWMATYLTMMLVSLTLSISAQSPQAMIFDGEDDMVRVPNTGLNSLADGDFTIETWVQGLEEDHPVHARILSNRLSTLNEGLLLHFVRWSAAPEFMMLSLSFGGNNHLLVDNGSFNGPILDGQCHHVAVTRTGDLLEFFVDGQSIGQTTMFGNITSTVTSNTEMVIGNDDYDPYPFNGSISEVRIWNYARTDAEVQSTMGSTITEPMDGLVSNWPLNEGEGQTVTDLAFGAIGHLGDTDSDDVRDPMWAGEGCLSVSTDIDELSAALMISSYPNPTTDQLTFDIGERRLSSIQVIDMSGRVVVTASPASTGRIDLNVAALDQGAYIALIRTDKGRMTTRFVKE